MGLSSPAISAEKTDIGVEKKITFLENKQKINGVVPPLTDSMVQNF